MDRLLRDEAARRIRVAGQLTLACNRLAAAAARTGRGPALPPWERHAGEDARTHRRVQAFLRERAGSARA